MLFASAAGGSSGNGGNFLIPNGTFVVELVIFLVVLGVIAKWILPPLQASGRDAPSPDPRRPAAGRRSPRRRPEQCSPSASGCSPRRAPRPGASSTTPTRAPTWPSNKGAPGARRNTTAWSKCPGHEIAGECRRAREELLGRLDTLVAAAAERRARQPRGCRAAPPPDRRGRDRGYGLTCGRRSGLAVASYLAEVVGFLLLVVFILPLCPGPGSRR